MKRKHKGIQEFLFIVISLILLALPAFHQCHDLIDFELLSPTPSFEKVHPQEMASGLPDKFRGLALASNISAIIPSPGTIFLTPLSHQPFAAFSINQQAPILRC
jgi:hypothetical protein